MILVVALSSCENSGREAQARGASNGEIERAHLSTAAAAREDGQWPMAAKTHDSHRFSGLREVDATNVAGLKVAWSFATGYERGHEAAPIVFDDTMVVVTPYPNRAYALDPTTGTMKWTYDPEPDPAAQGVACCDVVNRGAAYAHGRIHFATLDTHAIALDAGSGEEIWKVRLGDINRGETITMAPIVVGKKVLFGNSGGELGVRGWLTALDAATGSMAWRAWSTGPDADVLIGDEFEPHYAQDRGTDLGVTTWPADKWKNGGGTVWGWLSYDPELDLLYYGTANPGPWNADMRPGDNKWTAGIFARRPETGQAVWFYQWTPHDLWDHDGVNEAVLVDLEIDGRPRKVLLHPDRNGYVYVLDRETGEVLSADPFVHITTTSGVDLQTGRLQVVEEKVPRLGVVERDICPSSAGGKDWQPSAFSPDTGLLYIPHNNLCMNWETVEVGYLAGTPYVGAEVEMVAGPGGHRGELSAWDPIARKKVWSIEESFPVWSGVLATAGGVVFYGTMDGWFKAIDARSGAELWRFKTPSGVVGQPMTYRGADGKQYIAVFSGVGGWAGNIVAGDLDPRDRTAGLGFAAAMKDLRDHTTKGGTLLVFTL